MINKKAESGVSLVILIIIVIGIGAAFYFGLISFDFGKGKIITPTQDELPEPAEEQPQEETPNKFQQCTLATECNWDQTKYYNRGNCTGAWRCLESPQVGQNLCSYGCDGNQYCGDGICGGIESEWICQDCNPLVGFIGKLQIG